MGLNCNEDFDACGKNNCQNGGVCQSFENNTQYVCNCPVGFTGQMCEENIDDCIDVICNENEECADLINGYECRCPQGYEGENCSQEINECLPTSPCQNGATCNDVQVRN